MCVRAVVPIMFYILLLYTIHVVSVIYKAHTLPVPRFLVQMGDSDSEDSVGHVNLIKEGILIKDAFHHLPSYANSRFKCIHASMTAGEMGAALFYANNHSDRVVTYAPISGNINIPAKDMTIMCYNDVNSVWQRMDATLWSLTIRTWLMYQLQSLNNYCVAMIQTMEDDDDDDEAARPWKATLKLVTAAHNRLNSEMGLRKITSLAFTHLRKPDMKTFNSWRDILSFENGDIDLSTGALQPRTAAMKISSIIPYAYDAAADTAPVEEFMSNLFPDPATYDALHALVGYWASGDTSRKAFDQVIAHANAGKTTFFNVLESALGPYFNRTFSEEELTVGHDFEDNLAEILSDPCLCVRLLVIDDARKGLLLKGGVVNQLTDGTRHQKIQLKRKHSKSVGTIDTYQGHLIIGSNNPLRFEIGADGTMYRARGVAFTQTFDPTLPSALFLRFADPDLSLKQAVARWIVQGAMKHYAGHPKTCPQFERQTFDLRVQSSPYIQWLTENYTLTGEQPQGPSAHRVPIDALVTQFQDSKRFEKKYNGGAYDGIRAALDMFKCVTWTEWNDAGSWDSTLVKGFLGLRPKHGGDVDWLTALPAALAKKQEEQALAQALE